jgi:dihydrofolate reductase
MRKLKLQIQMSVDGFIGGPNGELDWMFWGRDEEFDKRLNDITDSIDTILLGRKMTPGFIDYWSEVLNRPPDDPEYDFAKIMMDTPKFVFSRTLKKSEWRNTQLQNGDTVEFINKLKEKPGKDIIVYGGANFVSSLIRSGVIDEYNLFINPTAIGKGLTIFSEIDAYNRLQLNESKSYDCGVVLNQYVPLKD